MHGGGDDDALGIEVNVCGEDEVDDGGKRDADEREQVGGSDDAALILFRGLVLDERVHRHGEESRPEAQHAEQHRRSDHAMRRDAEREAGDVMPIEPSGISPYSILLSLTHPAAMLPMPMPTASMAFR